MNVLNWSGLLNVGWVYSCLIVQERGNMEHITLFNFDWVKCGGQCKCNDFNNFPITFILYAWMLWTYEPSEVPKVVWKLLMLSCWILICYSFF